jgi:hypothetical protein
MPHRRTIAAVSALILWAAAPVLAQRPLYTRARSPLMGRQSPTAGLPQPGRFTPEQQLAIAPVKWPAVWPAPKVPPGTVLMVPPRPNWLPGPSEYWGPFTNDLGGWGFMVGPRPAPPPPPQQQAWFDGFVPQQRFGGRVLLPLAPPPPPEPVLPVAGPISPDGQMLVTYPDGGQVTWQFPMVEYVGVWNGLGPGGGFRLTERSGRKRVFGVARVARFTLNGRGIDPRKVPLGAQVTARALRMAPGVLTVMEFRN